MKTLFNVITFNTNPLLINSLSPTISFRFQCNSSAVIRNRNSLSFIACRFSSVRCTSPSCDGKIDDTPPQRQRTLHDSLLQVVLVSPQIPGNVGSIARTCAASAVGLHLVEPLGFLVDNAKLKRAGLDYWPYVVVKVHSSWAEFRDYFLHQEGEKRLLALTKRGTQIHSDFTYKRGDWLLFGSETKGLPPEALADCQNEAYGGGTIKIPMVSTYVRCLNLSVSVGISVYEASRQLNYEQLLSSPDAQMNDEHTYFEEDIFG